MRPTNSEPDLQSIECNLRNYEREDVLSIRSGLTVNVVGIGKGENKLELDDKSLVLGGPGLLHGVRRAHAIR